MVMLFFFFNDTATTEIYTLSLHDALPISPIEVSFCDNEGASSSRMMRSISAQPALRRVAVSRSEEHTSELQSQSNLVCRLLLEKKNITAWTRGARLQRTARWL